MTLNRDQELWGAALAIERVHGSRAATYFERRVTAAAKAGDNAGVATMSAIAARLDALVALAQDLADNLSGVSGAIGADNLPTPPELGKNCT